MVPRVTAATRSFPAEPASVAIARRFVRATLTDLGLVTAWEAAELLVSEVTTNAVLHAKTEFSVEVLREGDVVRVSVHDRSPVSPTLRGYGRESTTGRGMRLLATLAVAWGVDRHAAGKAVWFEVHATGDLPDVDEPWSYDADIDSLLAAFDELGGGGSPHGTTARHQSVHDRRRTAA